MKIRTRFYYHNKGKYFVNGGLMTIQDRLIKQLGDIPIEEEGRTFYFSQTRHPITYEHNNKRSVIDANIIITESSYHAKQGEFITRLNWAQQQKLKWMFRRHWLQKPANVVHLAILFTIVTLAFVGFELIQNSF